MIVAQMRIRWMCDHTRWDRMKNEVLREKVGVVPVEDKTTEARFDGLLMSRDRNALMWRYERTDLPAY